MEKALYKLTLFRLGFLGVPQTGGGGGEGGRKQPAAGTQEPVIFWQHTRNRKLVYFSSQINGSFVI